MEREAPVNLKQYIPKQASKFAFIKIVVYLLLLLFIGGFIVKKLNESPVKKTIQVKEIHGVKIELP